MADGGCNNTADVVELEAMRKDSFSWHPCQVSLCSEGLGLIVKYGDNYLEEMITDKDGVLARVRVRSTPLQGDDCSSLQQGDHVLATRNPHPKGVFCDARVEEAIRVRHSKRSHCRCSFTIKWLHQALEEQVLTVPASGIMKLATKSVNLHPTISTFFSMLESSNGLDTLPCSMVSDSLNWELDINLLLEKQIEEISNPTNVPQKKICNHNFYGLKVDLKGQSHGRVIDASVKDPCGTDSERKESMETVLGNASAAIPSIKEEFTGSKSPLSPLAARAALASLRSNFPQSAELSVKSNVEEEDTSNEHSSIKLLYGSKHCGISSVDGSSNTDDVSVKVSATLGSKSPSYPSIMKTLFPRSSAPQIVEFSNVSSGVHENETEKKNKNSDKKITQPSGTRLTRAQSRRNSGMHESTQMTNTAEKRLTRSSKLQKLAHSTVDGAEKVEVNDPNLEDDNMQTKCDKIDTSAENCLPDNQKSVASADDETRICSTENDKSLLRKDGIIGKVDSQNGTFAENTKKRHYPERLTRSAARVETEKNNVQPKLKFGKSSCSESNELDLYKGNVSGASKAEASTHADSTPNGTESVTANSQAMRRKSASSKKQETRSSPRLRFLPRTRSQNKERFTAAGVACSSDGSSIQGYEWLLAVAAGRGLATFSEVLPECTH
ncbi:hypothetical protein Salat_2321900 [Sesamum alatum]|uniref:SAWADEE domain-containing protein n=1 Tax=Sesamum alatum TaxID=300844 RepID=A0AAE2CED9_9LAMI|nr:hypothetical protein Salat_2321900 [Sesamum alatum]